ncbi:MAG: hypothetical protein AAGA25_16200 [Planctomycetota bacterium]
MLGFLIRILALPISTIFFGASSIAGGFVFGGMLLLGATMVILALIMLGTRLYEEWGSLALIIIGALIPLIGLVVILRVNAKANRTLRDAGWDVGFFGARKQRD